MGRKLSEETRISKCEQGAAVNPIYARSGFNQNIGQEGRASSSVGLQPRLARTRQEQSINAQGLFPMNLLEYGAEPFSLCWVDHLDESQAALQM
jgi:hypothetical protein